MEPQDQVEAVISGDADVAVEAWATDSEDLSVRFPAQVHRDPSTAVYFVVLGTEVPPFDNVDVRRAVNFAVDRDRVAQIFEGFSPLPTCQHLPPNMLGFEPYCPYTMDPGPEGNGLWSAPDLEEAQRLVNRSGTAGMRVVFDYHPFWVLGPDMGEYMIELLEDLGYRATARAVATREGFFSPTREFQMALQGWVPDYPGSASSMFMQLLTCEASYSPLSGFCDPEIDAMIDRAIQMQADDPAAAGAVWAEIDRAIVDQAPHVWLVNPSAPSFVSERVGNYQFSSQFGGSALLNQLWVR